MAEVTNELKYGLLRKIHHRMDKLEAGMGEVKHEIVAMRLQALSTQTDINNIYAVTARMDRRLERIEQRLELRELAETQRPYQPE